ncbi:LysR family transcriptional regulator [Lentibacter algarum]|uniref:LysR family transcriptional regulator n=1 Tax=Lentibacter algarum TaxID=576131 RepID=UPI001C0810E4|nr:LysR family transcriptional regulator [Lentibacter algarum]MBU2982764.1 LysR family transcriptional regulator [Lentibacter algarum]
MSVSPPRPKGPPLNALRAFEAAARLGSFTAAASELSVTAGAVSQQIKTLESWANARLFERRAQGVVLTVEGRALSVPLTRGFDALAEAGNMLKRFNPKRVLNFATLPSIAQLWLQPRLPALRSALGEISLSVYALETPPDLTRTAFECSLFLREPSGQAGEVVVADDALLPVCAPEVAARLQAPEDLRNEVLLQDESWQEDWDVWAQAVGFETHQNQQSAGYSLYAMALADAVAGYGVLLGHRVLVAAALEAGTLVAPFEQEVDQGRALVLEASDAAPEGLAALLA